jgi:hypothetical protein
MLNSFKTGEIDAYAKLKAQYDNFILKDTHKKLMTYGINACKCTRSMIWIIAPQHQMNDGPGKFGTSLLSKKNHPMPNQTHSHLMGIQT